MTYTQKQIRDLITQEIYTQTSLDIHQGKHYAEIEAEDPVCEFDCTNRDWTRVKITDGNSIYMSEECEFYDEDDY